MTGVFLISVWKSSDFGHIFVFFAQDTHKRQFKPSKFTAPVEIYITFSQNSLIVKAYFFLIPFNRLLLLKPGGCTNWM